MMTDPIADMLTRINNALATKKSEVRFPHSKVKQAIAEKLSKEGYVGEVSLADPKAEKKEIVVVLKYSKEGTPMFQKLVRVSKPGRRLYHGAAERAGLRGTVLLSTPSGILTEAESRKTNVGGETLLTIW